MNALRFLLLGVVFLSARADAAQGEFDPDALKFQELSAYFQDPEQTYATSRSIDQVLREADSILVSRDRFFISQIVSSIPLTELQPCPVSRPENVYLVIKLKEDGANLARAYVSDGKWIYSSDYSRCAAAPPTLLDQFDPRPR